MTKEELKQYIDENVYENDEGDITGEVLNEVLNKIVDECGFEILEITDESGTMTTEELELANSSCCIIKHGDYFYYKGEEDKYYAISDTQNNAIEYKYFFSFVPESGLFYFSVSEYAKPLIVANPENSATANLEKIRIADVIYQILQLGETSSTAFAGDRGKAIEDKIPSNASSSNKLATAADIPSVTGKADKVSGATNGNFAGLDSSGNLTDSGHKHSDYATAAQGAKADTAYQKPSGGIPSTDLASAVQTSLGKADSAVQSVTVGTTTTGAAGSNASVTNSGTSTAPVLDFTIPRGVDGVDGVDAVNPFKGWYTSSGNLPASPAVGDYAYVKGATSSDPVKIYECTTAGSWSDSGRTFNPANNQEFASGEDLNTVNIDSSHLANPISGSLAKAEDAMQLKAKLEGVTASEVKAIPEIIDRYVSGDTGELAGSGYVNYSVKVNVSGYEKVRFLGRVYPISNTTSDIGYSFGYYNGSTFVPLSFARFDRDSTVESAQYKEYLMGIPSGATHLLSLNIDGGYFYLQKGEDIESSIGIDVLKYKTTYIDFESRNISTLHGTLLSNKYIDSDDGELKDNNGTKVFIVPLDGADFVSFVGVLLKYGSTADMGYSFGSYENGIWTPISFSQYKTNTSTTNTATEIADYELRTIENANATHFAWCFYDRFLDCFKCVLKKITNKTKIGESDGAKIIGIDNMAGVTNLVTEKTLDSVAYENFTYRQIFDGSWFSWNVDDAMRSSWQTNPLYAEYTGTCAESSEYSDNGTKSIKSSSDGSSSYFETKNSVVKRNNTIYAAVRAYIPSYTNGYFGLILESGTRKVIEVTTSNENFETYSAIYSVPATYPNYKISVGNFGSPTLLSYVDTIVIVDMAMFTLQPTKAQMDALYNDYVEIKKYGKVNIETAVVPESVIRQSLLNYGFTSDACMTAFVGLMNAKAYEIGMTDSNFSNPYGGDKYGYNTSTAKDLIKMVVNACEYPRILGYMSQRTPFTPYNVVYTQQHINSSNIEDPFTYPNEYVQPYVTIQEAYEYIHGTGAIMPYTVLWRKGAGWGDLDNQDETTKSRGTVGCALIRDKYIAFAAFCHGAEYYDGNNPKHIRGLIQLLDICYKYLGGGDISGDEVTYCNSAMASIIPNATPSILKNNICVEPIYALNETDTLNPASATKVLSAIVMMDISQNLSEWLSVIPYDLEYDSSTEWTPQDSMYGQGLVGDKLDVNAAMWCMLGWSNGVNTLALARFYGAKVLLEKDKIGL